MKISPEHAARIEAQLPTLATISEHLPELAREPWIETFLRRSHLPPAWSWAYLFSTPQLVAIMSILDGSQEDLLQASREGAGARPDFPDGGDGEPKPSPRNKRRNKILLLACVCALSHTARAMGLHALTMDQLIDRGLEGDDIALRRAVAIDPTVLSLPAVNAHVSRLRLEGAKARIRQLYSAAEKGPNRKLAANWPPGCMQRVLLEEEFPAIHGHEEVHELVAGKMRLYGTRGDSYEGHA